jgi:hypothetical protein
MMLKPENLPFDALVFLMERIATEYRSRGIDTIDLSPHDFYRTFGTSEMFEVYADAPSTIGIGSLHDDVMELGKLLQDPDRMPTTVDIERLGNVLRAVSELM